MSFFPCILFFKHKPKHLEVPLHMRFFWGGRFVYNFPFIAELLKYLSCLLLYKDLCKLLILNKSFFCLFAAGQGYLKTRSDGGDCNVDTTEAVGTRELRRHKLKYLTKIKVNSV